MREESVRIPSVNGTGKFPTATDHHLQPKAISSKRIVLKSKKTTKSPNEDLWSMSGEFIYRLHEDLRTKLCDPHEKTFPIPLKYVSVMRLTKTDIFDNVSQNSFNARTEAKGFNLAEDWFRTTEDSRSYVQHSQKDFNGFKEDPLKVHKTTRPDKILPEAWTQWSKKPGEIKIAKWAEVDAKLQRARRNRWIYEVSTDDQDFLKVSADACLQVDKDKVPTMPCFPKRRQQRATSCARLVSKSTPGHQRQTVKRAYVQREMNQISVKEHMGRFHYGLVHMPITVQEALKIPEARAVVNNESRKLKSRPAWDEQKIKSKTAVIQRAKKDWKTVHFENLLDYCPLNNAELANRVVQRRDIVKDDEYCRAVFAQQGQQQNFWIQCQNFLTGLERHVTQFQRTLRLKWQTLHDNGNFQKKDWRSCGSSWKDLTRSPMSLLSLGKKNRESAT